MITYEDFFTGPDGKRRDLLYAAELTAEIIASAHVTLSRWNLLLTHFYDDRPDAQKRRCDSGWRPAAVNASTPGAAPQSHHMRGEAMDVWDHDRMLAHWVLANLHIAADIGLWFEDFRTTPTWVHGQIVPPKSGLRIFIPDAPWAARLAGKPLTEAAIGGESAGV